MNLPIRFHTGIRNKTIPNPAFLHRTQDRNEHGPLRDTRYPLETYEGLCSDYNFRLQTRNYQELQKILQRNGTDFLYVAAARYTGDQQNHRFVACSADGSLLWNKYVGYASQGGQNHVYVAGRRVKLTVFLSLLPERQDALLSNSRSRIQKAFKYDIALLLRLDESADLWS